MRFFSKRLTSKPPSTGRDTLLFFRIAVVFETTPQIKLRTFTLTIFFSPSTQNRYPSGDNGVEFRLLSDFLDPEKISPLDIRQFQITEDEFLSLKEALQQHILDYINEYVDVIDGCGCDNSTVPAQLPWIDTSNGGRDCKCYGPEEPPPDPVLSDWKGSYIGQQYYLQGGKNVGYQNGGVYPVVVTAGGAVSVNGQTLTSFTFENNVLSWTFHSGVTTDGRIRFHTAITNCYHFGDKPGCSVGQSFTGRIRRSNQSVNGDFRGLLQVP